MRQNKNIHEGKDQNEALKALSESIGDFIRYWGFRRIHGQLWTQIYLSPMPLSGADLMRRLEVSKALVSPALNELQQYRLIECTEQDGRTKTYKAHPEVFEVIRQILKEREKTLIQEAQSRFEKLNSIASKSDQVLFDKERIQALGEMISAAGFALDFIIGSADPDLLPNWFLLQETANNKV